MPRKKLQRTGTVALLDEAQEFVVGLKDEEEEEEQQQEERPASRKGKKRSLEVASGEPASKRQRVSRAPLAYATTTVLRSLDEAGPVYEQTSMVHSLRSASFHTRKALQKQLASKKEETAEHALARRCLSHLASCFTPSASYAYEHKEPSHVWQSKAAVRTFQAMLLPLCAAAAKTLAQDPMVVALPSPCYVLGDLHGNYKDLMFFKRSFWKMGMEMSPARFLFLGDYVDRGPHGVELTAYLLALKIMHPQRVFLLRGNHECAEQNGEEYYDPSFLQNCEELFAKKVAKKIWKAFNDAFEWMPLAATIDEKIFCCHGGIPRVIKERRRPVALLDEIGAIERPLTEDDIHDEFDSVALDLLWSDPATTEEERDGGPWFSDNDRGGDIKVFGSQAVEAFMKKTGCTHIIRAHQPPDHGIELCKSARIITVFSSSHYCGRYNSAAIVLVNEGRLRVATTKADDVMDDSQEYDSDELLADEAYE